MSRYITSVHALVNFWFYSLILALWPSTTSQSFIYSFTVVHGFVAVSCNLVVTLEEAHI